MRTDLEIAWRLLRGGGRRGLLGTVLTLAAVAVSTGLLLFSLGAVHAFGERATADAWRHPAAAKGRATAVQALSTDYVRGRPITVVDLAALSDDAPVPPGMSRFPRPGETWTSPGLAALMVRLPAAELAGRFPARAGTLREDALVHPGELVAVVGRAPGDPAMTAPRPERADDVTAPPARIDRYATGAVSTVQQIYQVLAAIAAVLMVVPLLVFGGAAARLTVARRDERLAALRLVGATPGQVVAITVAEAVLTAAAGALAGVALYAPAVPALTHVTIAGGGWYAADLWPPLTWLLGVLAGVPLLVGVSAVAGLRRVVVSPLGVARRETPPAMRAVRLVALGAVLVVFALAGGSLTGLGKAGAVILLVLVALAFLAINLAGPWAVALVGRITAATARTPARLLAGRRLLDDPRSAWRTVAGIALTGFVAGFLALLNPSSGMSGDRAADRLELTVPHAQAAAVAARAGELLHAPVQVKRYATLDTVTVTVPGGEAAVDRARTALHDVVPGQPAVRPADDTTQVFFVADLRTGALTVLAASFLIAITSAGITGASAVLDRRRAYAMLRLAGTPLPVLDRARRQETLLPLVVMGGGSLLTGLVFASPFGIRPGLPGLVTLLVCVALGFGGVLGASALSRPLLRSVTADPAPRPD
ncbi:FtsX-like permease family protein [Actinomadura macrotermitis]|uniref:FtsX-like permease family protein n=1 Tax=Actinomadura macrotermitis TaxID=2585200 RepID=A0A7K0BYZ4_9ACTN|nr:FtsX-like permease family protein [Actinomadura macrotermitis]MQY06401.1 hypothetical protein [Actinomadura macrotermitis]